MPTAFPRSHSAAYLYALRAQRVKPSFESLDLIQKVDEISCIHNAQILVCSKNYRTVHRQLHPITHWASCGAKLKHGHFIQHSSDAKYLLI